VSTAQTCATPADVEWKEVFLPTVAGAVGLLREAGFWGVTAAGAAPRVALYPSARVPADHVSAVVAAVSDVDRVVVAVVRVAVIKHMHAPGFATVATAGAAASAVVPAVGGLVCAAARKVVAVGCVKAEAAAAVAAVPAAANLLRLPAEQQLPRLLLFWPLGAAGGTVRGLEEVPGAD
jgi:hypothetical protein